MAYLSKNIILAAYRKLSELTSDPSAQGATQATSSLRYLFALVRFYNIFNRPCDTRSKNDREKYIEYVGEVVAINDSLYTGNFFNAIREDDDYKVGSNFFSVNTVKQSIENSSKDYVFPKRGNSPLFIIRNGELILEPEYLSNLGAILFNRELRSAFAIWLVRNVNIETSDPYSSIKDYLAQSYSDELVSKFMPERNTFSSFGEWSFENAPAQLEIADFPIQLKQNETEHPTALLSADELVEKVRGSFKKYWELIDQHGADYDSYILDFETAINPCLVQLGLGYTNIFQIVNFDTYSAVISEIISKHPEMTYLSAGRKNSGAKYVVSSTHLHFKNYLKILSISDFRSNIDQVKNKNFAIQSKVSGDNIKPYLRAMRTKPFLLLAGISGTGKSRIVRELAFMSCPTELQDADGTTPGNYCMVEVKPNWHDSTDLLGYYSNIQGKYVFTNFVKFLVKAKQHPETPFFVCLDEMNLAPVEQYFAEFLSVLETRSQSNGEIRSGALIKADQFCFLEVCEKVTNYGDEQDERRIQLDLVAELGLDGDENATIRTELKTKGLTLPENIVVVGTVNMDDTTYKFSRKVIDRAMTLEMNGGALHSMFGKTSQLSYRDEPVELDIFKARYVTADDAVANCANMKPFIAIVTGDENADDTLAHKLYEINKALDGTPFQVSYRVMNELVIYLAVLLDEEIDVPTEERFTELLYKAVDEIALMKILPRIEGDDEMFSYNSTTDNRLAKLSNALPENGKSRAKVAEMLARLEQAHFTRFWP